jgi:predicted Rossmann fold nucleotide-binding protein DprA/Smf involved in DNA uptake
MKAISDWIAEPHEAKLAVPGEITSSLSKGPNALLRIGATPGTCAEDVLEVFGIEPTEAAVAVMWPG